MADLTLIRGDSFPIVASIADTDITGWAWAITMKRNKTDTDADAVLSTGPTVASDAEVAAEEFPMFSQRLKPMILSLEHTIWTSSLKFRRRGWTPSRTAGSYQSPHSQSG